MQIPSGYAQINFIFTGDAVPNEAQCTLGLDVQGTVADPAGVGAVVGAAWGTNVMPNLASTIQLDRVLVKFGPNSTGPAAETSIQVAGGKQAFSDPPHTAILVRKNTGFGGRTGRGRMFVPGVYSDDVDSSGYLASGLISALLVDLEAFRDDCIAADLIPVLLHAEGSGVSAPLPITSFGVDSVAATQRRRLRR